MHTIRKRHECCNSIVYEIVTTGSEITLLEINHEDSVSHTTKYANGNRTS